MDDGQNKDASFIRHRLLGAATVWARAMTRLTRDFPDISLVPDVHCGSDVMLPWTSGDLLFQYDVMMT